MTMLNQPQNPEIVAAVKTTRIIAAALLAGPVMMLLVAHFIGPDLNPPTTTGQGGAPGVGAPTGGGTDLDDLLPLIASGMGLMCLPVALMLRHRKSKDMMAELAGGNLKGALEHYRAGILISYALLEGPMLFIGVTTLITGGALMPHAIVFAVLLAVGIVFFPNLSQFEEQV